MSERFSLARLAYRRRWVEITLLSLAILLILATGAAFLPIASGADEAAHYVYASAVARGQAGMLDPTVPERIANTHRFAACIAFQPDVTAACQGALRLSSNSDVQSQTNAGLYNPVFYFWVGLGSLIVPTEYGMYISRALAAVVTAGFLGWGLSLLRRGSLTAWPLVGAALFLTPMTLYVGMVVNPSAWEIATLFCVSVAAYQLLKGTPSSRNWTEQHTLLAVSGAVLIVTRGLSPLLLLLTAVAVVTAVGWRRAVAHLAVRATQVVSLLLVLVAVLSTVWVALHGTYYVGVERPASLSEGVEGISIFYASYYEQLNQMYGDLGWLDLPSPHILSLVWLMFIGAFLCTALSAASRRGRVAIVLAFASATLLPGVLAGLQWSGVGWQGRYSLPLVVALLIIAGCVADDALATDTSTLGKRSIITLRGLATGLFFGGAVIMALQTVHRYSVGLSHPWLAEPSWAPPVPGWVLGLLWFSGMVYVATFIARAKHVPSGSALPYIRAHHGLESQAPREQN